MKLLLKGFAAILFFAMSAGFISAQSESQPQPAGQPWSGVGVIIVVRDGKAVTAALVVGGPAVKDGRVSVGDVIAAVAQGDGPWVPTDGMSSVQVAQLTRGETGTIARLKIWPSGSSARELMVSLVRAPISAYAVAAAQRSIAAPALQNSPVAAAISDPAPISAGGEQASSPSAAAAKVAPVTRQDAAAELLP